MCRDYITTEILHSHLISKNQIYYAKQELIVMHYRTNLKQSFIDFVCKKLLSPLGKTERTLKENINSQVFPK
jgi:hypothetical protein